MYVKVLDKTMINFREGGENYSMIKGQPIIHIQFQKETDIGGRKNHSILIP